MRMIARLACNIGLRLQIGALATIGVLGLMALSTLVVLSDRAVTGLQVQADRANWIQEKVSGFDRALLLAKRAELDFLLTADKGDVTAHASLLSGARASLQVVSTELEKASDDDSRDMAGQLGGLQTAIAAYAAAFADIVRIDQAIGAAIGNEPEIAILNTNRRNKLATTAAIYNKIAPQLANLRDKALELRGDAATQLAETRIRLRQWANATAAGLLLVTVLAALVIGAGLTRALRQIVAAMRRLAADDHTVDVSAMAGRGEIGEMAKALGVFRATAVKNIAMQVATEAQRSESEAEKREAMMAMAQTVENATVAARARIAGTAYQIDNRAGIMAGAAERADQSAKSAAVAAADAMTTTQTVASAAEQLNASIVEIAQQVDHATTVSGKAVAAGDQALAVIEALATQTHRIGAVVQLISEVAARTNLLALNATIEAARAGDAGRGFAVVAGEVKSLSAQTTRATEEIARELAAIGAATTRAVAAVSAMGSAISEMDSVSGSIAAAVEQQGAATADIARYVTQTAAAAETVSRRIMEVSHETGGTGEHTRDVQAAIVVMNDSVQELAHEVVRAVRTSTSEVSRRKFPRYAVDRACQLIDRTGKTWNARLSNISLGGAAVVQLEGEPDGEMRLRIGGQSLACAVLSRDARGGAHLMFTGMAAGDAERARLLTELGVGPAIAQQAA